MNFDDAIAIPIGIGKALPGHCRVPSDVHGMVVFIHGSGSSRHSPRNRAVADYLTSIGLGTLLFDLLTEEEGQRRQNIFDIDLLTDRVTNARGWLSEHWATRDLPIGLFGASTGAAAALASAAMQPSGVDAIVSRGGRPDMASRFLAKVTAPTMLIVGGQDTSVLEWNKMAATNLRCESRVEVVPGATHLFEEPGALETVADLAGAWFLNHMRAASQSIIR
jgi:putative phosphoribosyl transferase